MNMIDSFIISGNTGMEDLLGHFPESPRPKIRGFRETLMNASARILGLTRDADGFLGCDFSNKVEGPLGRLRRELGLRMMFLQIDWESAKRRRNEMGPAYCIGAGLVGAAGAFAPVHFVSDHLVPNNSVSEVQLQQAGTCLGDTTAAVEEACAGGPGRSILTCGEMVAVGSVESTRDPYKDNTQERPLHGVINANGRVSIISCPGTPEDIANALPNRGNVGVGGVGASNPAIESAATSVPAQNPETAIPATHAALVEICTVDGVGYTDENAGYPPKTNLPLLGDLQLDPERANIDYFIIDTSAPAEQRVKSVLDQLNAAYRTAIPWAQINSPEAILRLAEVDFPYTFPAGERVVLTPAVLSDIFTFLECTQYDEGGNKGYVTRLYDPLPGPTATPPSVPEKITTGIGDFVIYGADLFKQLFGLPGRFFNWLRSLAPDARSLIEQDGMVSLVSPLSTVESGYSGRVNARYKDILSQLSDSNHPLASFYENRIRNAPNRRAAEIWARRAVTAGV